MLTIDRYLRPETLEEAYEAAQKKNSVILGGMMWLRLGNRRIGTAIDLSALGLDKVEETDDAYRIGAYATLRELETHTGLNELTDFALRGALSPIVGVQFRNLATVGGSVFGRYGFSDIITLFLALNASVELYKGGVMPLFEFCRAGMLKSKERDILTCIHIPKENTVVSYKAQRNQKTDFPVLNVCAALNGGRLSVAVGARPLRASVCLFDIAQDNESETIAERTAGSLIFASNKRASEEYRQHLCRVLVRRAVDEVFAKSADGGIRSGKPNPEVI
jgi:CO/xanthine dehydrogenase FAD-binding subunit